MEDGTLALVRSILGRTVNMDDTIQEIYHHERVKVWSLS